MSEEQTRYAPLHPMNPGHVLSLANVSIHDLIDMLTRLEAAKAVIQALTLYWGPDCDRLGNYQDLVRAELRQRMHSAEKEKKRDG